MSQARAAVGPLLRAALSAAWLLVAGCGESELPDVETPAPAGSELPHLARDLRGTVVLSWVEPRPNGHALRYARLEESGWREPVTVAQGVDWFVNWADVPSVTPLADDLWAAHWLVKQPGGMYAYDIALSLSRDGGRSWEPPFAPHRDGTPTEHGFVSLWPARLVNGQAGVGLIWLDGRHNFMDTSRAHAGEPRTSLRAAVFAADGQSVESVEVDGRVCDCCRTDSAAGPDGLLIAYRDRTDTEVRDITVAQRDGNGWRSLGSPGADGWTIEGCPVNGPAIAANGDAVAVAWYTEADGDKRVQVTRRALPEGAWQPPVRVGTPGHGGTPLGRVDLMLVEGGDAVVSWMTDTGGGAASIRLARVRRDGTAGPPFHVAATESARQAGVPRIIRHGDDVLVAWTRWRDRAPQVMVSRVPMQVLR